MGVSDLNWGKMLDKPVMVLSMSLMYFVSIKCRKGKCASGKYSQ